MSPTQRSLALLRQRNYTPWIVERWIAAARKRIDLYGIGDIIAIHNETGDVLVVQSTSGNNVSSRVDKIINHDNVGLLRKAGIGIWVHGWRKLKSGWAAREVDLS